MKQECAELMSECVFSLDEALAAFTDAIVKDSPEADERAVDLQRKLIHLADDIERIYNEIA